MHAVRTMTLVPRGKRRPGERAGARESSAGVSFDHVCRLAAELPGIERGMAYGTPALRVRGKFLLRLKEDGESVAIRVPMETREMLLAADPEVFYITDHYRGYAAILFRLAAIRRGQLTDLLELAWRFVAPRRLVVAHDAAASAPRARAPRPRR